MGDKQTKQYFGVMSDCIFCRIVDGTSAGHIIWQDDNHLAFLSIYPNTKAFTVVITKEHYPSYAFDLPDEILSGLVIASKKVGKLLDSKLDDVGRTGLILEGFGVDHVHAKLFPMHGTGHLSGFKQMNSNVDKYFEIYEGYISSHDYEREDDEKLAGLAARIRV